MRWVWAWIVAAMFASAASAAVTGRISSIGFQSFIRLPDWTPLVVQTTSDEPAPHTYDLQVVQTDLDGDEVVYTRTGITVNPGTQTFRTYFRPETSNNGLPVSGTDSGNDLAKRLRVFLYDPATGKRAVRVGVAGALPQAMEDGQMSDKMGQKLILVVGRSPSTLDYAPNGDRLIGLAERRYFVQMDPARLPDSALAYGAVDAIVWTDADAARITPAQLRAVRQYVQNGGTLAVVQTPDTARAEKFADMLPVKVGNVAEWNEREPIASLLQPKDEAPPRTAAGRRFDPWQFSQPPYRMADATKVDDTTVVADWVNWGDGHRSPLIARRLFGLGCVAWIAQDISDPNLASVGFGWPRVWQRLMDWRDDDLTFVAAADAGVLKAAKDRYANDGTRDLGASFVEGVNPDSRTIALLSLAFVFFVGYWALVGPVSYGVLAARKKTGLSWFVFGAIAAAATVLTIGIARLVLGGEAQAKHVSLVRVRAGEPARVLSRVGVYLPRDTTATVSVPQTPDAPPAALSPFESEPAYMRDNVTPRDSHYEVPVGTDIDAKTVSIDVPFRSTLKKLQADWTGPVAGGIGGSVRLLDANVPLEGRLSNDTGGDLTDVILLWASPFAGQADRFISMPDWKKGQTLDLASLYKSAKIEAATLQSGRSGTAVLTSKINFGLWPDAARTLYDDLRSGTLTTPNWKDNDRGYYRSFPLASLFGRCPPMVNYPKDATRVDLLRRGVRQWDVSPAVAAGGLVVIGKATGPLPVPLTVNDETPKGDGQLFFQAIVPVDRSVFNNPEAPATQPE